MMSAKYHMPNCFISILMDKDTEKTLTGARATIYDYIDEKNFFTLDKSLTQMQKSRWLKTSMRNLIDGDFLYVDVDTVFAAPIDESLFTNDVMGVPDGNCLLKEHPLKDFIEGNLKKLHFDNNSKYQINSGVLFFKDSPLAHSFAECWHKRWHECCLKGVFIDQPALHQAIVDSGCILKLLPDCMNAQFGRNINTLAKGVILHYYSSWSGNSVYKPAYKFLQTDFLNDFRFNPKSDYFQNFIHNPKEAFNSDSFVLGTANSHLWNLLQMAMSKDRADQRLYNFLKKQNAILIKFYYQMIKCFFPIKKFFQNK